MTPTKCAATLAGLAALALLGACKVSDLSLPGIGTGTQAEAAAADEPLPEAAPAEAPDDEFEDIDIAAAPAPDATATDATATDATATDATAPDATAPDATATDAPAPKTASPADVLPLPGSDAQPGIPAVAPAAPPPGAGPVPHIYLAFQSDGPSLPVSAIFAIDTARDNTPSDDPAIRLTPENGLCNPQEMRNYRFPPAAAARPVATEADQDRGLTAANLPDFMAFTVSEQMLAQGLARKLEDTRALNICTRKLWQRLTEAPDAAPAEPPAQAPQ